jgi:hypothetical protein
LDIRVYYTDGTGNEWKPTRKGLTVRRDREILGALRDALDKALVELPVEDSEGTGGGW